MTLIPLIDQKGAVLICSFQTSSTTFRLIFTHTDLLDHYRSKLKKGKQKLLHIEVLKKVWVRLGRRQLKKKPIKVVSAEREVLKGWGFNNRKWWE